MPALYVLIFTKIADLKSFIAEIKASGKTIGFVPTMGALHYGHISLIEASKKLTDLTICSIFVNPTQFNDKKDLERYPKTPKEDTELLKEAGCDVLFMPEANEMYPEKDSRIFDFGYLDKILEGAHRPGHFNGVAQIVSKLFEIVQPHKAFFGSKDYQQVMIVKALVKQLNLSVEIIACPILREDDGLAMSSRNMLLTSEERSSASLIPQLMQKVNELKGKGEPVNNIIQFVKSELNKNSIYKLDYFSICDAETLQEIITFEKKKTVALIACFVGKIRLIDNIVLN